MKDRPLMYTCLVILVLIMLAVTCGKEKLVRELRPSPLESAVPPGDLIVLQGQVYQTEQRSDYQRLYLKDNSIQYQEQTIQESRIIIYTDSNLQIHMGNKIKVRGEVSFFENARNPGNFDQKRYYQIRDIHGMVWAEEIALLDAGVWKWRSKLAEFRRRWQETLVSALGVEDGTAMGAMMLGERTEMDQELKMLYQVNGIGHILAISGLHLSFMGIGMYQILRRLTGSYPVGGVFGILFLALYILMVGLTVSAVRALVMFLFRVGADMTGRHYDAPTAFSFAAAVVLLWRPLSLYDGGFWLSFGAVLAILVVVPALQDVSITYPAIMQRRSGETNIQSFQKQNADRITLAVCLKTIRGYIWQGILKGLTASIGVNLIILPILLYYFFEFPIYSLVLNLFVIPLMSVLLFMGMAGSLFSVGFLPVSGICFWICGGILRLYKISCNLALTLPGARFVAGKPKMWQIAVYYGIMVIVLLLLRERKRLMEHVDDVDDVGDAECKKYKICGRGSFFQKQVGYGSGVNVKKSAASESGVSMQQYTVSKLGVSIQQYMVGKPDTGLQKQETSKLGAGIQKHMVIKVDAGIQKRAARLGRFALMLGMAGVIALTHRWGERGKMTTVILDVGQGDGIFMRGPEGGTYLVDGGSSDVKKVGQYRIETFLKSQGVGVIDYVLISHGDSDHMNGVEELIERQDIGVRIGTLILPVQEVWDEALVGIAEKAKKYGVRVVVIGSGQSIKEGNMTITCIQPGNPGTKVENRESEGQNKEEGYEPGNEASMVLAVKFGKFDMLLTGDVEGGGEEQLTKQLEEQYRDCTWEILKVAHHGSKNSSSEEFLRQVKPAYAFISAGRENRYGHPHQETIERLTDVGSKIYSTQENGAIIVGVEDGDTMKVGK